MTKNQKDEANSWDSTQGKNESSGKADNKQST